MKIGKYKLFQKNVGKTDRIVRLILGVIVIVASYMYLTEPINYIGYLIGIIILFTGIMSTCLLYEIIGINTNKK